MRFKDPQKVHGLVGQRHRDRRRVRPDPPRRRHGTLRRPWADSCSRPRTPHRARSSTGSSSTRTAPASTTTSARPAPSTSTPSTEATGVALAQLQRVAQMLIASQRTVFCWAMGLTQHRHAVATIGEATNLLLMRGMIGKPGAGVCPVRGHSNVQGDRTMGIWEKMPEAFPGRAGPAVRDQQPAQARLRHRRRDPRDARRTGQDLHRHGRQLRLRDTRHRGHRGRAARVRADRADLDEAQPQPRRARADRPDPADAGPHRSRHPGRRQTACLRRGFDVDGASVAGQPAPAQRPDLRSEVAIVCQLARTCSRAGSPGAVGTIHRQLRPHPRRHRRRGARMRRLQPRVRQPDGFQLPHPPRDSREFPTATGKANFSVKPLEWVPVPAGPAGAADPAQPRPVQHHHLRSRRPLPRRQGWSPGGVRQPRRHRERWDCPTVPASIWSRSSRTTTAPCRSVARKTFWSFPIRPRSAMPRPTTRRPIRWCRSTTPRPVQHPGVEGRRDPTGAGPRRASGCGSTMGRVTTRRRAAHLTASADGSLLTQRPETLVVEEPLEIRLNGTPLTVTMRTPGSDVELAQGFLLTEGVIDGRDDVLTVRYCRSEVAHRGANPGDGLNTYNVLDVTLAPGVPMPDVDRPAQLLHHLVVWHLRQGIPGRGGDHQPALPRRRPHRRGGRDVDRDARATCGPRRRCSPAPAACTPRRCSPPTGHCW